MTTIEFGRNLTSLRDNALVGCTKLKTLYFRSTTPPSLNGTHGYLELSGPITTIIYTPNGTSKEYKHTLNVNVTYRAFGEVVDEPITIHVDKAGTLSEILDNKTARNLTDIILTGELNYDDFKYLRRFAICFYNDEESIYFSMDEGVLRKIALKDVKLIDDGKTGSIYG